MGALLMYPSLELLGRRMTVIISDTIFIIGAILCTVPTHQIGLVYHTLDDSSPVWALAVSWPSLLSTSLKSRLLPFAVA